MPASSLDKLQEVGINTATTLDAPGYTIGGTSLTVASTANMPTATGITVAVDVVDSDGVQVPGSYNEYVGVVTSGTAITSLSHVNGTDRNYSAGATTRVYLPVSAERENRIVEWGTADHSQAGAHEIATNYDPSNPTLETQKWVGVSSAVNEVSVTNSATGNAVSVSATGDDTNINLNLTPKGTGYVNLNYAGALVQAVSVSSTAVATTATAIPYDDSIPQSGEGASFLTLAITPKSATNILVIELTGVFGRSASGNGTMALFQDSGANALAAVPMRFESIDASAIGRLTHTMVAGTTSATTFKLYGGPTSGTLTFNGVNAGRVYGAITKSSIVIYEYKAS